MRIQLKDLTITTIENSDSIRLQSGRVSRWRTLEQVRILFIADDYMLEFDDLFIDLDKDEAESLSDMLNKDIVSSEE